MNARRELGVFDCLEDAASRIADAVEREAVAPGSGARRWVATVPDTDPLAWLNFHEHLIRMYCSSRERNLQIAAMGCADIQRFRDEDADVREALEYIVDRLENLPEGMRYYGGMRFDGTPFEGDTTWSRFGRVRFVLPSVELIREDGQTILAANLAATRDPERELALLVAQLRQLKTPPDLPPAHLPPPSGRVNFPDRDHWETMVSRARDLMRGGKVEKLVLARRCAFEFGEALRPMALLQRLREMTPDSFHFCFNYGNEIAFIGATPERLYQRRGRKILSEALAGTRPRGATSDEDQRLASELMQNTKERREQKIVADAIARVLETYCSRVLRDDVPEVLKLHSVQHLRTTITGELKATARDADLLMALHPTPAVGGSPGDEAVGHIRSIEPFDRGWYAAPIGWAMKEEVEFAVAIRCALVEGSRLSLFSGAGILAESDPEQEWREIESKLGNFVRILTS